MRSLLKKVLLFLAVPAVASELVLRYGFGFCNAPLYIPDTDYEYIYAPGQDVRRFGKRILTNSFSMRNEELSPADSVIILLLGDSVVNGGSLTDNDSLASTLLEKQLSASLLKRVRVLNISAGSWGPDNGAAYLEKHGLFGARLMCLVASSHDAHDNMTHENLVGEDPNLPDRQFAWALEELWKRYLYPLFFRSNPIGAYFAPVMPAGGFGAAIRKDGAHFNPGFARLNQIARENRIPFFIYLHPEISEIKAGDYNGQGYEIIRFAEQDSVRLVKETDFHPQLSYYRKMDVVHYNNLGQRFLAENLYPLFLEYLKDSN